MNARAKSAHIAREKPFRQVEIEGLYKGNFLGDLLKKQERAALTGRLSFCVGLGGEVGGTLLVTDRSVDGLLRVMC